MVPQALLYECEGFRTFFPTKAYPFVLLVCYQRGTITPLSYPSRSGFRTTLGAFVPPSYWFGCAVLWSSGLLPLLVFRVRRFEPTKDEDDDMGDNEDDETDNALSWGAEDRFAYGLCAKDDA